MSCVGKARGSALPLGPIGAIDTIDASFVCPRRAKDEYCHALLASPPVITDLNMLIRHDEPPRFRSLTKRDARRGGSYWELNKD